MLMGAVPNKEGNIFFRGHEYIISWGQVSSRHSRKCIRTNRCPRSLCYIEKQGTPNSLKKAQVYVFAMRSVDQ